jgi:hypothetical protein
MSRLVGLTRGGGVGAILLALPAVAAACPACARDGGGPAALAAVGGMIALPFVIAAVLVPVIRRGPRPR